MEHIFWFFLFHCLTTKDQSETLPRLPSRIMEQMKMRVSSTKRLLIEVRQRLRTEIQAAESALATLETFLASDHALSHTTDGANGLLIRLQQLIDQKKSHRRAVLEKIVDSPKTANEISRETGLALEKVRGVLYANTVKPHVIKERGAGDIRFFIHADFFAREFGSAE